MGGSSTFVVNLAHGLRCRGLDLPVVNMSARNYYREELTRAGATIQEFTKQGTIYEDRLVRAASAVAGKHPRAVIASLSAESFEILRYVPTGVLRIGMIHADDPGVYQALKIYVPWIDVMVGVSESITEKLRTMEEFSKCRIEYIPYGIAFVPIPDHCYREPTTRPLRVIYAGRLIEEQKRISRVVEVVKRFLPEAGKSATIEFTIVGSGPQEAEVRAALEHLPHVQWLGSLSSADVQKTLLEQDVFLLLSDYEGLPLALLEAMGAGVVPVISDIESGIRNLVTNNVGYRIPIGNVNAAVGVLSTLAGDRSALPQMSDSARRIARAQFSSDRMAERFLGLLPDPAPSPKWPKALRVQPPLGLQPTWKYHAFFRPIRRVLTHFRKRPSSPM